MHGFSSGSSLLVNAEVDSMGGIVDSGVGISTETSPRHAAIVKAQVDLSLEYDVREERRRELEFLEKGGNPLDFKFEVVTPVSVQSSSLADQVNDQFRTCEAKGSFAFAASPHGDSIGSSGRKGATVACEPNSADNFDGENELIESEGKLTYATRTNIAPSDHSSQLGGSQNVRESEDSPNFHPRKAYRRRNRSKTNRDSARSSSTGIGFRGGQNSSLSDHHGVVSKVFLQEPPSDTVMDVSNAAPAVPTNGMSAEDRFDLPNSKHMHGDQYKQNTKDCGASTAMGCAEPDPSIVIEQTISAVREIPTCSGAGKPEKNGVSKQLIELREPDQLKGDEKCSENEDIVGCVAVTLKGLDSETSCSQTNVSRNRNGNTSLNNVDIGEQIEQKLPLELPASINDEKVVRDREVGDIAEGHYCTNDSHFSRNHQGRNFPERDEEGTNKNQLSAQSEAQCMASAMQIQSNQHTEDILVVKEGSLDGTIHKVEGCCSAKSQQLHDSSVDELTKTDISCSVFVAELQLCDENQTKAIDKEHEERILEEVLNIKAKRKIMEELSLGTLPMEYRHKSHWDFVLEEMAWMANDFSQERVWKRTAATQLCYRAAFASRLRLEEQNRYESNKVVAQTLAKAVADFWHSAALLVGEIRNSSGSGTSEQDKSTSGNIDGNRNAEVGNGGQDEEYLVKNIKLAVQGYAVRFLRHNSSVMPIVRDAFSTPPERVSTIGMSDFICQNQHPEENLFYVVPHRAMKAYRNSVERYLVQCERAGNNMQEVNASTYEAVAEYDYQENEYEEDEGENLYRLPGAFEGRNLSKFAQKKWKSPKQYSPRVYEVGGDLSYGTCTGNRTSGPPSTIKRLANGLNGCPIPTKRVRTASRQRVIGPFRSGATGFMSVPSRTDASSGDTNSFQDDQTTECGGSLIPKGLEVQSGMDYNKQAEFDSTETAVKPKKKKKAKHQAAAYDSRLQVDCSMQIEPKDHFRKRLEHLQFDSNGNIGPFGSHPKKPKIVKQSLGNSNEDSLMSGSVASPVGSQMSNMSNSNKLIKLIGGRDRGRKTKSLKMPSGQTGSVRAWSLFEDQALVVLVHDMGPNWELVSDAINSTLHFKCIFRKSKECKERHRVLLEKSCGDGVDKDDSASQPYPSTLPGIPKGGARQLFQQLRGPMEEDTIKSHFEKIILIGQQLRGRKEPKQLVPAHSSHLAALSQVIPDDLNGGVLTPLDLCDIAVSSPDVFSLGHQGPNSGGLPLSNQGTVQSMLPSSTNSSIQGSASAQLNGSLRDGRYGIPRTNLPIDEQQRIQQYNHMVSNRNIQQPNTSVPGTFSANDRGGHMSPSGNGMVMSGMSRSMPLPRPGLQGVSPSPTLSSGSMSASNMVGMTSSMNMPSGATAGQGNSVLRPRDGLHMARPGQNPEHLRQMVPSEMQMQGLHLNNQGVPTFGGLSSTFPNQSASPSGPIYPVHQQQHQMPRQHSNVLSNSHHPHLQGSGSPGSTEQQAFAMRLARDRQLQQRILQRQQQQNQQQHQQFPASGALISHARTQSQLPTSTPLQNSSQMKSQTARQPGSSKSSSPSTPVTSQQQEKHQLSHHGLGQTAQSGVRTMINEGGKQRQLQAQQLQQELPQSGRHHPPNRQPSQFQQAKLLKGMGRGSMSVLQNHPVDYSHLDGLSDSPGSQLEKGEQAMCLAQGQGYPTQSPILVVPSSTQSHPQQKLYPNLAPASLKQVQQIHSHPDSSYLSQAAAVTSASTVPSSNHGDPPSVMPSSNHQQPKLKPRPPSKLVNDGHPTIQKAVSQSFVAHSDRLAKPQNDQRQDVQQKAKDTHSTSMSSGIPPLRVKSTNAVPVASSDGSAQWKTSEPLSDPIISNSQLGSIGSPSMLNSSNNEPVAPGG